MSKYFDQTADKSSHSKKHAAADQARITPDTSRQAKPPKETAKPRG